MRGLSPTYLLVAMLASCSLSLSWCDPKAPLKPDICVIADGSATHRDLVTAKPPAAGTTACSAAAASPATGRITTAQPTDVSRTGLCAVSNDPSAELLTDDDAVRVCMFYNCNPGTTNVFDCYESSPGDSRGSDVASAQKARDKTHVVKGVTRSGFTGCCRTGKGRVAAQMQCSGIFAAKVEGYLWVEATDGNDHAYSVSYELK